MKRLRLLALALIPAVLCGWLWLGQTPVVIDPLGEGLQTNGAAMGRFNSLRGAEPYLSRFADLQTRAAVEFTTLDYEGVLGESTFSNNGAGTRCEVVGVGTSDDLELGAELIKANALMGLIYRADSNDALADAAFDDARNGILGTGDVAGDDANGYVNLDGFGIDSTDADTPCIAALSAVIPDLVEAVLYMEEDNFSTWTTADGTTFRDWLHDTAFLVVSLGAEPIEKDTTSAAAQRAATVAALALRGHRVTIDYHRLGRADFSTTPDLYIDRVWNNYLLLLGPTLAMDGECENAGGVWGQRVSGAWPDGNEKANRSTDFNDCAETSLAFDVNTAPNDMGLGHADNARLWTLGAGLCEALKVVGDTGIDCYAQNNQAFGAPDIDAIVAGIEYVTGGDYITYYVPPESQALRYVVGEHYADCDIIEAAENDAAGAAHGGYDYTWTSVTHAPGVRYATDSNCGAAAYLVPDQSLTWENGGGTGYGNTAITDNGILDGSIWNDPCGGTDFDCVNQLVMAQGTTDPDRTGLGAAPAFCGGANCLRLTANNGDGATTTTKTADNWDPTKQYFNARGYYYPSCNYSGGKRANHGTHQDSPGGASWRFLATEHWDTDTPTCPGASCKMSLSQSHLRSGDSVADINSTGYYPDMSLYTNNEFTPSTGPASYGLPCGKWTRWEFRLDALSPGALNVSDTTMVAVRMHWQFFEVDDPGDEAGPAITPDSELDADNNNVTVTYYTGTPTTSSISYADWYDPGLAYQSALALPGFATDPAISFGVSGQGGSGTGVLLYMDDMAWTSTDTEGWIGPSCAFEPNEAGCQ